MNWSDYEERFIIEANKSKKTNPYIEECLAYAKILFFNKVPIIYDFSHFCKMVGYDKNYVARMIHVQSCFYRTFSIKKRNGNMREISEPLPDLKSIQKWVKDEILDSMPISPFSKAYVKSRSIKDNAKFHRNQRTVLTIDIKDFFPSITFWNIYNVFKKLGYKHNVSTFLANLCSLNGSLPQGAPTSPMISNAVCYTLDYRLGEYAKKNKLRYTRYADDLTFSGDINISHLLYTLKKILLEYGFTINTSKTRISNRNSRQEVTGIVVNSKLQLPRSFRRDIRQQMYFIKKYGLDSHLSMINETRRNYIYHLFGQINHVLFVNPYDEEMRNYTIYLKDLISAQELDS